MSPFIHFFRSHILDKLSILKFKVGVWHSKGVRNSPLSLVIIIPSLGIGGTEKHLLQILPKLTNIFATVKVFVLHPGGEIHVQLLKQGIQVIEVPKGLQSWLGPLGAGLFLFGFFLRERIHVVHFFLPEAYLIGGLCALPFLRFIRVMSRRNLNNYQGKHRVGGWVERRLHNRMDAVLGNSKAVVEQLKQEKVDLQKIGLIYNGVEVKDLCKLPTRKECRRMLGFPLEGLIFITVANLHAYKGHEVLLKGIGQIFQDLPKGWMLLCLGRDKGTEGHLKNISRKLGLAPHVWWMGEVQDVNKFLRAASIGILASQEEGFSNSILESMASGLPMVVTGVGGNPEAVVDNLTGFVVPPKDPIALGKALLTLARDPVLCDRMGREGQKRVESEFSLDQCVKSYEQVYRGLMDTPRKSVNEMLDG